MSNRVAFDPEAADLTAQALRREVADLRAALSLPSLRDDTSYFGRYAGRSDRDSLTDVGRYLARCDQEIAHLESVVKRLPPHVVFSDTETFSASLEFDIKNVQMGIGENDTYEVITMSDGTVRVRYSSSVEVSAGVFDLLGVDGSLPHVTVEYEVPEGMDPAEFASYQKEKNFFEEGFSPIDGAVLISVTSTHAGVGVDVPGIANFERYNSTNTESDGSTSNTTTVSGDLRTGTGFSDGFLKDSGISETISLTTKIGPDGQLESVTFELTRIVSEDTKSMVEQLISIPAFYKRIEKDLTQTVQTIELSVDQLEDLGLTIPTGPADSSGRHQLIFDIIANNTVVANSGSVEVLVFMGDSDGHEFMSIGPTDDSFELVDQSTHHPNLVEIDSPFLGSILFGN